MTTTTVRMIWQLAAAAAAPSKINMYKLLRHFQQKIITSHTAGKRPRIHTHTRIYLIYTLCCDETRRITRIFSMGCQNKQPLGQPIWYGEIDKCIRVCLCARLPKAVQSCFPLAIHSPGYPHSINEILLQSQFPCSFSHIPFLKCCCIMAVIILYVRSTRRSPAHLVSAWQATITHNIHEHRAHTHSQKPRRKLTRSVALAHALRLVDFLSSHFRTVRDADRGPVR